MISAAWRRFSTATTALQPRVLCSLEELKKRQGNAIKFPLSASSESSDNEKTTPRKTVRGGRTGFVFFCDVSQAPRAFVNRLVNVIMSMKPLET